MDRAAFDLGYAVELLPALFGGLLVTLRVATFGTSLALLLGLVLAIAGGLPPLAAVARWTLSFVRSTPLLVQLYVWYFGLPALGVMLDAVTTGILALGVHYASYAAEVYRAGIQGVPQGQLDAARALGLSRRRTFVSVVLPQALASTMPALGNCAIALLKDTPMLSAITVAELVHVAQLAGSRSFRYLEPMTLVGLLFLVVSTLAGFAVTLLQRRLVRRTAG
jgi:polar amino acid transport system permease protein